MIMMAMLRDNKKDAKVSASEVARAQNAPSERSKAAQNVDPA